MNKCINLLLFLTITVSLCFGYSKTDVPEGWASQGGGTTGGTGGTEVTVSSAGELSSAVKSSEKKIILVKPGTYGSITIGSDKSVLGIAPGVKINGSIRISGKNVIVRNISVQNARCNSYTACRSGSDAVYIGGKGATNIWLDHMDISDGQDGNLDITKGPDNITVTWTKFHCTYKKEHSFSNLIAGSDGESESEGRLNITYAYCWWADNIVERQPRGRFGKIHVLNNLYTSKRCNYIVGPGHKMQMLIEHNVFNTSNKDNPAGQNQIVRDWGKNGSASWKSIGNIGTAPGDKNTNKGTVFTPPYTIKKFEAKDVEARVSKGAGAIMTLGQTDINEIKYSKVSNRAKPFLHISKKGWILKNPGNQNYRVKILAINGKELLSNITVSSEGILEIPRYPTALIIKFNNGNMSNIYVPGGF
jgi:pectate lyase